MTSASRTVSLPRFLVSTDATGQQDGYLRPSSLEIAKLISDHKSLTTRLDRLSHLHPRLLAQPQ